MVKKLFKHEFKSYRTLLLMYIIMLAIAVWGRIVQLFEGVGGELEYVNSIYSVIISLTVTAGVFATIAMFVLTIIQIIVRFYRNMFTGEGYLTFTLPVKTSSHIFVKLTTAVVFQIITVLVALLSVCIMMLGDPLTETLKAIGYLWKMGYSELGMNLPFYVIEIVLNLLVSAITGVLLYYSCMCIGQLFNKNRVLWSVGVYFGYSFLLNILSGIFNIAIMFVDMNSLYEYFANNLISSIHIIFITALVVNVIVSAVYYIICNFIIHKKLNLE